MNSRRFSDHPPARGERPRDAGGDARDARALDTRSAGRDRRPPDARVCEPGPGPLDARAAALAAAIAVASAMLTLHALAPAALLAAASTAALGRVAGARAVAAMARRFALVAVALVVLNGLLLREPPFVSLAGTDVLSLRGIERGGVYALRLAAMVAALAAAVAATTPRSLAGAASSCVRPFSRRRAGDAALATYVAAAWMPRFRDEVARIRTAQRLRAPHLSRVAAARALAVVLLVSAMHRASRVAEAVTVRGLEPVIARHAAPLGWRARERAVVAAALALALVALALDRGMP